MLDIKFIIENQKLVEEDIQWAKKNQVDSRPDRPAFGHQQAENLFSGVGRRKEPAEQFDQIRFRGRTSGNHRQKQSPRRRTEG